MPVPIYQVDAFASEPFRGNPAAVCFPHDDAGDEWLARVAAEMNLSETAFLWPEGEAYRLRWLTPVVEVDLCGHATLASAHILWESGRLARDRAATFHTRSGELTAVLRGDTIELDFPATEPRPIDPPPGLLAALGLDAESTVLQTRFDYMIVVPDERTVRELAPDHRALKTLGVRGVMVTARATSGVHFVSRFFAPGSGIDEDPVTGSAHCALGPYWSRELGERTLRAYQASPRGGALEIEILGDRVKLRGRAVTVVTGQLLA